MLEAELLRTNCPAIETLDDVLHVDDLTAKTMLPYGLTAELFKMENDDVFNYCNLRYQALKAKGVKMAAFEDITDCYGW